ncbi:glycoside hydrolase domain-containing protein [Pedobacter sp. UC225_65]|uniref:glycoside hydrolase domain-containing protein n=1 Tax=Pedobacter sp. UC225_65 TaxID=3350173 RepID=UPI00366B4FF7
MKYLLFIICTCITLNLKAQDVSLALQKKPKLDDPAAWTGVPAKLNVSFASANMRFAKELPPKVSLQNTWTTKAWKGEKIHTQLLVWTGANLRTIRIQTSDLKDGHGNLLKKENLTTGFINYVMTDEFRNGCGYREAKDFDSSYVADLIDTKAKAIAIQKNTTQPIWLSIRVPENTKPGNYKGTIKILGNAEVTLSINVEVLNKTLPAPSKWHYDLDLWQHPASIARVHNVPLWSNAHFTLMKSYYQLLASAGQKTITTSIVNEPWGHQTYDDYPSLVKWTKKKDGSWVYDYSLFDKYVSFVMSCGIDQRINCYSMVPWKIAFTYFDESLQKETVFTDAIGTPSYNAFWKTMLTDFTKHLKQKGWFNKTYIAMDERPMKAMQDVIKLLKSVRSKLENRFGWRLSSRNRK